MKEAAGLSSFILERVREDKRPDQKRVSFSQYSVYEQCPHRWYLTYAQGNYLFSASINTVFGTAIHEAIQEYIKIAFADSVKAADSFDIIKHFETRFREEYLKEVANNEGKHFSNKEEMAEFYEDGIQILDAFKKKRSDFISPKHHELLGIEIPINIEIKDDTDTFLFQGFVDLGIKDKRDGVVYMDDFKTSTKGWTKYEKGDEVKQSQALLYKKFFSKQYGVDQSLIVPRFRILKRKLWEGSDFPQSRIQVHEPANGTGKVNAAVQRLINFINECFDKDGTPKEKIHIKKASPNNCRFCPFKDRPDLCNKSNII